MPLVHKTFDPESAHRLAIAAAKWKIVASPVKVNNDKDDIKVIVIIYQIIMRLSYDVSFLVKQPSF